MACGFASPSMANKWLLAILAILPVIDFFGTTRRTDSFSYYVFLLWKSFLGIGEMNNKQEHTYMIIWHIWGTLP